MDLNLYVDPQPWRAEALCAQADPDLFMEDLDIDYSSREGRAMRAQAIAICHECPVMAECRQEGMKVENLWADAGIYGGLTARQRIQMSGLGFGERRSLLPTDSAILRQRRDAEIKSLYLSGVGSTEIGLRLGLSERQVSRIVSPLVTTDAQLQTVQ